MPELTEDSPEVVLAAELLAGEGKLGAPAPTPETWEPPEELIPWLRACAFGGTLRLSRSDASALLAEIAEREAAAYQRGQREMRQSAIDGCKDHAAAAVMLATEAQEQAEKSDTNRDSSLINHAVQVGIANALGFRAAAIAALPIKEKPEWPPKRNGGEVP